MKEKTKDKLEEEEEGEEKKIIKQKMNEMEKEKLRHSTFEFELQPDLEGSIKPFMSRQCTTFSAAHSPGIVGKREIKDICQ